MQHTRLVIPALLSASLLLSCSGKKPSVAVEQVTNASYVTGIAVDGNTAYCATLGGLVIWDLPAHKYTLLTTANGLPSNTLTDVIIDGKGKLWVASDEGVAMRDGSTWKRFDATNGLPSSMVSDLALDRKQNVWAATDRGVVFFKNNRPRFLDEKNGPGEAAASAVYIDPGSNIWIGTVDKGLFVKLQGDWQNLGNGKGYVRGGATVIATSWDNRILVSSEYGAVRWEGNLFIQLKIPSAIESQLAVDIASTRDHTWLFTKYGVHVMRGSEWTHYTEREGLISNTLTCGFVVSDDRVFAGTDAGMSLIEKGTIVNYTVPNTPHGSDFVCLGVDNANRLLVGTRDMGLGILDTGYWELFPGGNPEAFKKIQSIVFAPDKTLTLNTSQGIATLRNRAWEAETRDNGIIGDNIRCGVYDREGRYWVGTSAGVSCRTGNTWTRYRVVHGLPAEDVRACALDSTGAVWFGTASGIASFAGNTLTNWTKEAGDDSIEVTSVAASGNRVYFGTADGRLVVYDGKSWDSSKRVAAPIVSILIDPSGAVWLGSDGEGLFRTGKGGMVKYSVAEGMPSNRVRALAIYNGRLVAACYGGIGFITLDSAKK